jgi:hypothetical protein
MEWWCGTQNTLTKDWTEVNDGKTTDTTPAWNATNITNADGGQQRRQLKPSFDGLVPTDFEMDYAINGKIKTMKRDEWHEHAQEYVKNVAVWPLLNDETMAQKDWDGEPVEVAISKLSLVILCCFEFQVPIALITSLFLTTLLLQDSEAK